MVNRRHPYEVGKKKLHKKKALDEEQTNGQKHTSNASTQYQGNKTFLTILFFTIINLPHSPIKGACI
jgi:hypothetical protein